MNNVKLTIEGREIIGLDTVDGLELGPVFDPGELVLDLGDNRFRVGIYEFQLKIGTEVGARLAQLAREHTRIRILKHPETSDEEVRKAILHTALHTPMYIGD